MSPPSDGKVAAQSCQLLKELRPENRRRQNRSLQNAYKYGIRSDEILYGEDKEEFAAFAGALQDQPKPEVASFSVTVRS